MDHARSPCAAGSSADDRMSEYGEYREKSGIFIIAPIGGPTGERIAELHRANDPCLLKLGKPHVTLIGSSGAGPVAAGTPPEEIRARLEPITASTRPITVHFQPPTRFMQTEIVVLPLDPHGPLRELHERIKTSGLELSRPRFYFTPHVTLSLYRELPPPIRAKLLRERFAEPVVITEIQCHLTRSTGESSHLLTLQLSVPAV